MSLQFPYKAQPRLSSRSKPATRDTLFQKKSCQTSGTVHEVSLRTLWLRIQCSLVELGLPASMTSERIHPCILLTSHSFVILENRTRCSITVCLHPLKPKRKEMLKPPYEVIRHRFTHVRNDGVKQCHVVSRKENS